jgi:acyl-CoA synthetase (AMP-forming)/AMP-acid ligase II
LVRAAAADNGNRTSVLADTHDICVYPQIPAFLDEIQRFVASSGVRREDCVALELNNSVRAALSVLALLDGGYSFLALPVPGQGARSGGNAIAAPELSRWVLTVAGGGSVERARLDAPATYLSIYPNPDFDPDARVAGEGAPRMLFRTSGSLGAAKLAVHHARSFYNNALNALERRRFAPRHRIALPTPIFHMYGLCAGLLPAFAGGASIDLQERSNILKYLAREEAFEPNVAYVTPSLCEALIRARQRPRAYEFMVTSGDRISEAAFRRCEDLHGPMVNQYGSTEMGIVAASDVDMPYELRCRTVGRPVPGVEVRIVEPPPDRGAEEGAGELQIRHAYGFKGYVDSRGRRIVPPRAFADGWYRTGDLAAAGPAGTLRVLGRCDLSVNRNGVLLPIAEVESRLREIDGVEEVAVATGSASLRGLRLIAFCVRKADANLTARQLRAAYAASAPAYSVPDAVVFLDALPKLESGKVDRRALARMAENLGTSEGADQEL